MTIGGVSQLHQALYAAIEASDADAFNSLLRHHLGDIEAAFDSWTVVPEAIRADQAAVSRYVQSLFVIAQAVAAAGEPAFMEQLVGPHATNPIVQWQRRLSHAQALSEAGEYADSTTRLEEILAETEGVSGNAVVNLRPKVLGRLGFNALHQHDYAAALDFTAQAYDASRTAADEEGRVAYYENFMSLRVIHALDAEPERGQQLLDVRRHITRAQDSADAGCYQASIDLLFRALSAVQDQKDDELFRALSPKIHGLLGFNEYKLGDAVRARDETALALTEAETVGDADGVRIYTANLEAIDNH